MQARLENRKRYCGAEVYEKPGLNALNVQGARRSTTIGVRQHNVACRCLPETTIRAKKKKNPREERKWSDQEMEMTVGIADGIR